MRVLEVRGRNTGRWYQRPVAVAAIDGQRYIVSLWASHSSRVSALEAGLSAARKPAPGRASSLGGERHGQVPAPVGRQEVLAEGLGGRPHDALAVRGYQPTATTRNCGLLTAISEDCASTSS
jgi:hypothetical protein